MMQSRDYAYCGVFGALALVLPFFFHLLHLGALFMPMYLPLMALAFFVGPGPAALTAAAVPMVSGVVTGMPPFYPPVAPLMSIELAVMAAGVSWAWRHFANAKVFVILFIALALGRVLNAALSYSLAQMMDLPAKWVAGISFFSGWPGIVLMLLVIPGVVAVVEKRQFDPQRAFFDRLAEKWDSFQNIAELESKLDAFFDAIGLGVSEKVIDLGCGTGNVTAALLKRLGPDGRIWGVDFSGVMLDKARAKITDPRAQWLQTDAAALPLASGSCDRVICFSAWPHFRNPAAVIRELGRVLKPGGETSVFHFISRGQVNHIHQTAHDSAVHDDVLPPASELAALFTAQNWTVVEQADDAAHYLVRAKKGIL